MKPVFIQSTALVAPQTFTDEFLFRPVIQHSQSRFTAIEPDYSRFIPPLALRRMSKVLKMAVFAGLDCLNKAGINCPDGIIAGTGRGNLTDTETFLKDIDKYQEGALTPTPFILSTYNSVCGSLALQTGATGYNQTFVHRGHSFEHALLDAQIELNCSAEPKHYLVGGFDEITEEYLTIKKHLHYWKKDFNPEVSLLQQCNSEGSVPGEAAGFFLITNQPNPGNVAIISLHSFEDEDTNCIPEQISRFLDKNGYSEKQIDLLVLGLNGDQNDQQFYEQCMECFDKQIPIMAFKHLCGEFETSGIFGLSLICQLKEKKELPAAVWYRGKFNSDGGKKTILFYNSFRATNHNLILLEI